MSNPYPPYDPQPPQQPQQPYGAQPAYGQIPQQPYPAHDYPAASPGEHQGYPQPGYPQQPGYPEGYGPPPPPPPGGYPPGYGQASVPSPTQYGDSPYGPPPRKRRKLPIVLSILAVLVVACGLAVWLVGRPYLSEYPATLTAPDTLVGHKRSTDPQLRAAATQAVADLRREINLQDAIAEFYQDPVDETRIVWLVGGTKFILDPGTELNDAFRSATGPDMSIDKPKDVDPGPLGGVARCGEAKVAEVEDLKIAVCAWADHGSLVIVMFIGRGVDEGAELLRQIRAQILSR